MSKLLALKHWTTISEAASYLSETLMERVTEADVLRLGLDGHLTLSVYFVNKARARKGRIVPIAEAPIRELPSIENENELVRFIQGISLSDEKILILDEEVSSISGVWDLPMIGAEALDIEHRFQCLIGGPDVTLATLDGAFVRDEHGSLWQLQEHFEQNECFDKSRLKEPYTHPQNYYPAGGLPDDGLLVIRTRHLTTWDDERSVAGRTETRNQSLQSAANSLAEEWKNEGRKSFSKRELARKLATTDEWNEMTAGRIERLIRVEW